MSGANIQACFSICSSSRKYFTDVVYTHTYSINPANIYLLKVNNRKFRKRCEVCSKLAIKNVNDVVLMFYCWLWTYFTLFSGVFIADSEQVNLRWEHTFSIFVWPTTENYLWFSIKAICSDAFFQISRDLVVFCEINIYFDCLKCLWNFFMLFFHAFLSKYTLSLL